MRRSAGGALQLVLDWRAGGSGDEQTAAALRRCGLPPAGPLAAVALTVGAAEADPAELPQVARVLLEELLPAPVAGVSGAEAVALAPGGEDVLGPVRDAVAALARVPRLELALGVSVLPGGAGPAAGSHAGGDAAGPGAGWTVAGVCQTVAQARQARRLAALPGGGVRLVDAAGIGSLPLLLALIPGEAKQAFRARLLDPLLAYDREHGTELVRTLRGVPRTARDHGPRRPRRCSCTSTPSGTGFAGSRS